MSAARVILVLEDLFEDGSNGNEKAREAHKLHVFGRVVGVGVPTDARKGLVPGVARFLSL